MLPVDALKDGMQYGQPAYNRSDGIFSHSNIWILVFGIVSTRQLGVSLSKSWRIFVSESPTYLFPKKGALRRRVTPKNPPALKIWKLRLVYLNRDLTILLFTLDLNTNRVGTALWKHIWWRVTVSSAKSPAKWKVQNRSSWKMGDLQCLGSVRCAELKCSKLVRCPDL